MASAGEHNEPDASQLQRMVLPQAAPNFLDPRRVKLLSPTTSATADGACGSSAVGPF
jgi:hypothetical protein